jgi:hypothetical protein
MDPADTAGLLMTVNVTFNVPLLAVVTGIVLALLVYTGILRYRRRQLDRRAETAARLIAEYFREHQQEVTARCFPILGGQRFVAVVESPPVKRFRYSHIVESSLIQHLLKTAGIEVDKVYWRFPLAGEDGAEDPYLAEGQALLEKTLGNYKVEEAPWESYEKAVHPPDTEGTR